MQRICFIDLKKSEQFETSSFMCHKMLNPYFHYEYDINLLITKLNITYIAINDFAHTMTSSGHRPHSTEKCQFHSLFLSTVVLIIYRDLLILDIFLIRRK